jgi:CubicO group peptidase (beta-lactamase class C family)
MAALLAPASIQSCSPTVRDCSALVGAVLASHRAPGLWAATVDLEGATSIGVAGVRKQGTNELLTLTDAVHLGSNTKAMTATLIAQLIEANALQLQSTMSDLFPDLSQRMDSAMSTVTVSQLLAHEAGLPANVDWWSFARSAGDPREQRRGVVEALLTGKPLHPPPYGYLYSNVGYVLLGAIVESKRQLSWEDAIRAHLFDSLGMDSIGFGPPPDAWGHLWRNSAWQPTRDDNPPVLAPAGRVHCSMPHS